MLASPFGRATTAAVLLAADLLLLLLLQATAQIGAIAFPLIWMGVSVAGIAAMVISIRRNDLGGALAWGYIALPLVAGSVLLALQVAHTDASPTCELVYSSCPINSPAAWLAVGLSLGATFELFRALRATKAVAPEQPDPRRRQE